MCLLWRRSESAEITEEGLFWWYLLMNASILSPPSPLPDNLRVVVAAGGTGGHIFPAVAVVEALQELTQQKCQPIFMGSRDRMEATIIPKMGYPYVSMPIAGFRGLSFTTLTLPLKVMRSILIARGVIRAHKPHAVICTGAYISYPVGVAAQQEGVPVVVLESNINPGKTNTRLAPKSEAVVLAFNESIKYFPENMRSKLHVLGNPVRNSILAGGNQPEARLALGLRPDMLTALVFGGSLGAHSLNIAIERMLPQLHSVPWQILWQTGRSYHPPGSVPENVHAVPFIDSMALAYTAADVVVSRSGATTIAELGVVGKPAILVPLASASTNEQARNARVVEEAGAAKVVGDNELQQQLFNLLNMMMSDEHVRSKMAHAMSKFGKPNAAMDVAQLVATIGRWEGNKKS